MHADEVTVEPHNIMIMVYIVQFRCNFILACEQFTHTLKQFSYRATHGMCFISHEELVQDY